MSGQWALRQYLVPTSNSGARLLESEGIRSALGHIYAPHEAQASVWAVRISHPEDLRVCELTGKSAYFSFVSDEPPPHLKLPSGMLEGATAMCRPGSRWIIAVIQRNARGQCSSKLS